MPRMAALSYNTFALPGFFMLKFRPAADFLFFSCPTRAFSPGANNYAPGDDSYALGDDNYALGDDSYALGDDSYALGDDTYARPQDSAHQAAGGRGVGLPPSLPQQFRS